MWVAASVSAYFNEDNTVEDIENLAWMGDRTMHYLRYEMFEGWRPLILSVMAVLFVAAVGFDVTAVQSLVANHGPLSALEFPVFYTLAWIWTSYNMALRFAYSLDASGDQLTWKTPLRTGRMPLSDVQSISSPVWGGGSWALKTRCLRLWIMPNRYVLIWATRLSECYPHVDVRLGRLARTYARAQGQVRRAGSFTRVGTFEEGDE